MAIGPFVAVCALVLTAWADEPGGGSVAPTDYLVVSGLGGRGRASIPVDPVAAKLAAGSLGNPQPEDPLDPAAPERKWTTVKTDAKGEIPGRSLRGGYALWRVSSPEPRAMILDAGGHDAVYVNGEPRVGNPYGYNYVRIPVKLAKGENMLLFRSGRGNLRARLTPAPASGLAIEVADATVPDVIVGEPGALDAAVVVLNASDKEVRPTLVAKVAGGGTIETPLPGVPTWGIRKVAFRFDPGAATKPGELKVELTLRASAASSAELAAANLSVRVRMPDQTHKRTFTSSIDGSVQYYAVNPAPLQDPWRDRSGTAPKPALFLSLHGASVEAMGQADAYSSKSWGYIVAPSNRRPYGFDWEDWGRLDAIEVLELAAKRYDIDPMRVYLTGHSMGGHGAWHLGATFPDRFAAVGPSAGWISFWSYAGGARAENPSPIELMLLRSQSPSDTVALASNYAHQGVYILHGGADDNVPVGQAREMNRRLGEFHRDFRYFEQPGAGHWWDVSQEPGADCVDWAPMFDFFARHALPADRSVREIEFKTASPRVSAKSHWVSIEAQERPLEISSIKISADPHARKYRGVTRNVARLAIDLVAIAPGEPIEFELDGAAISNIPRPARGKLRFERSAGAWTIAGQPDPAQKGPHRYGPFKDVFNNKPIFVYGTHGTDDENRWSLARAKFDAESFWYRGNASIDVTSDAAFNATADPERNVIIYGNADTNSAYKALLSGSDVVVERGVIRVGERTFAGDDRAILFLKPRPGSRSGLVGVVSGAGLHGMRITDRLPYVLSGTGFPDCLVLGADAPSKGVGGILAAGFFGLDWSVKSGEFVWKE